MPGQIRHPDGRFASTNGKPDREQVCRWSGRANCFCALEENVPFESEMMCVLTKSRRAEYEPGEVFLAGTGSRVREEAADPFVLVSVH